MSPARLLGISAIARRLNVSRQRAHVLVGHDGFPAPAHELETGRVWRETDVERWIARNPRYDHTTQASAARARRRATSSRHAGSST
jgi:prophage regulatory protein